MVSMHAFPSQWDEGNTQYGLTALEYFAACAMAGFMASPNLHGGPEKIAKEAVACAEALIAALDKVKH